MDKGTQMKHGMQYLGEPLHKVTQWVIKVPREDHEAGDVIVLNNEGNSEKAIMLKSGCTETDEWVSPVTLEQSWHVLWVCLGGWCTEGCYS